ncbi:hypothetical protein CBM2634_B120036 [Cupriavidus taiwanensis]|uniref:Uncharacterized protein n=1 Tax=Cupriavidus taiwanensis TaxID=164546 RepID=A0A375J882_9BURK|nr:hypothetical protein CBM2634_B120036 [Cupriavidus taiwanensis]
MGHCWYFVNVVVGRSLASYGKPYGSDVGWVNAFTFTTAQEGTG